MTGQLQPVQTRLHMHGTHGQGRLRHASDERLVSALRRGDERAFEAIYDRYSGQLLGFCRHMLGSREEAEDALQHVFVAAHRHLLDPARDVELKPWLYAVARNRCVSMLRARRPTAPLEPWDEPSTDGLAVADEVERREGVAEMLADLARLPEEQRAALLLAEFEDLSHKQIGKALGVPPKRVKALIFQARTTLAGWRQARATDCSEIQEQLATLRGSALRRASLRRHVAVCPGCDAFEREVSHQHAAIAVLLPVVPSVALKEGILGAAATGAVAGGAAAGGAAAGGGLLTGAAGLAAKTLAVVVVAAGAGGGAVAVRDAVDHKPPAKARAADHPPAAKSAAPASATMAPGHATRVPPAPAPLVKGHGTRPDGGHKTPPRHAKTPPGQAKKTAPGQAKTPPGQTTTPPGQLVTPPGELKTPPGKAEKTPPGPVEPPPGKTKIPPGQAKKAPAQVKTPPGQAKKSPPPAKTPPGKAKKTPPGKAKTPPGKAKTPPGKAKTPPGNAKGQAVAPVAPPPAPEVTPEPKAPKGDANGHDKVKP